MGSRGALPSLHLDAQGHPRSAALELVTSPKPHRTPLLGVTTAALPPWFYSSSVLGSQSYTSSFSGVAPLTQRGVKLKCSGVHVSVLYRLWQNQAAYSIEYTKNMQDSWSGIQFSVLCLLSLTTVLSGLLDPGVHPGE